MTEQEWADEPTVPEKKKGLPGWLWFCGGGCLIAVVLAVVLGFFLVREFNKATDPELQWSRLEETIAMDVRPPEMDLLFGWDAGLDVWMFQDQRGYMTLIYYFDESQAEARDEIFQEGFEGGGIQGLNKIEDPQFGEVEVQGRVLPVQRFYQEGGSSSPTPGAPETGQGPAAFVDITPEGNPGFMMLFMIRVNSDEPVPDEFIQEMLAPFHVGPNR